MLTNNANPRFSYMRRVIVLPLLAVVVILFSFRSKEKRENLTLSVASVVENVISAVSSDKTEAISKAQVLRVSNIAYLNKKYTVVIAAGHGGDDKGMLAADGTSESEMMLQLARKIKAINANSNIDIVLTRDADIRQTRKEVMDLVNDANPDMYISLHTNSVGSLTTANNEKIASGVQFFIPTSQLAANYTGSRMLASAIAKWVGRLKQPMGGIRTRAGAHLIIDQLKSPGVMIETGFITNAEDVKKLKDDNYQMQLANLILNGVNDFLADLRKQERVDKAVGFEQKPRVTLDDIVTGKRDTVPPGAMIITATLKDRDGNIVRSYPTDTVMVKGRDAAGKAYSWTTKVDEQFRLKKVLLIVDGARMPRDWPLDSIKPEQIARIDIFKDKDAIERYGDDGKDGVIMITTKKNEEAYTRQRLSAPLKTENVPIRAVMVKGYPMRADIAEFPGGAAAWIQYLDRNLHKDLVKTKGGPPGKYTVLVSFVVSETGELSDVRAENDPGYGTKEEAIRVIEKGPRWKPATKNGKAFNSVYRQGISFIVPDDKANGTAIERIPKDKLPVYNDGVLPADDLHHSLSEIEKVQTYHIYNGQSYVRTAKGSEAWLDYKTDVVIVNGKQMTPQELNSQYKSSEFIAVAMSDTKETKKKYGSGILVVSSTPLKFDDIK